jgi:hypothetical protein
MNAQAMMWPGYDKVFPRDLQEKERLKKLAEEKSSLSGPQDLSFARVLLGREAWQGEQEEEKEPLRTEKKRFTEAGESVFLYEYQRFLEETAETREGILRFCGEWSLRFAEVKQSYC